MSDAAVARDPWPILPWLRRGLGLEIVGYAGLTAFSVQTRSSEASNGVDISAMRIVLGEAFLIQGLNTLLWVTGLGLGAWLTYRTARNAQVFAKTEAHISPFWSVAWYFVPVA